MNAAEHYLAAETALLAAEEARILSPLQRVELEKAHAHALLATAPAAAADLPAVLLSYGEWLDSEGLVAPDDQGGDRSHAQLVDEFLRRNAPVKPWGES